SLGVVLYELLAGVRPYKLQSKSAAAVERQILEVIPPPPSSIAADTESRRALRGDLDKVVLMALAKAPQARYPSVEAFIGDIQRYLDRRPVLARPQRAWYRAALFVRRHRLMFLACVLGLSILLAALTLAVSQARAAFVQKKQAEEANALLVSLLF